MIDQFKIQNYKHNQLPPFAKSQEFVGIDTEIAGLDKHTMHLPLSGEMACVTIATETDCYLITDLNLLPIVFGRLEEAIWVFQNAKFDLMHLRQHVHIPPRKRLWDTMIIEQIMFAGYYDSFGLDSLARRYLDMRLSKDLQKSFDTIEMSSEQIEYALMDAEVTRLIALEQKKLLKEDRDSFNIWTKVDRPFLWAVLDFTPFRMDAERWLTISENNRNIQENVDKELPFNPRSYKVVKEELRKVGFIGLPNTSKGTLIEHAREYPDTEAARLTELILVSRSAGKMASTYGKKFLDRFSFLHDGCVCVKPDFRINGAETGRSTAKNPPIQTIPSRDTLIYRECFISRHGNKLVVLDYSQQEPRILAYLAQDEKLIQVFTSGKDVYLTVVEMKDGDYPDRSDPRRKKIKDVVLGTGYGMSAIGLAERWNCDVDEAQEFLDEFMAIFPDLDSYLNDIEKSEGFVKTILGRKIHLNPYSSQSERNARNAPVQGSAGDMLKQAVAKIHQEWEFPFPFAMVTQVYDEVVLDVPERFAHQVLELAKDCMIVVAEEMCPGVPFVVDGGIYDTWGDAK